MTVDLNAITERARAGNDDARAALVQHTESELLRFFERLVKVGGSDTAADLAQETYLRAFRALPTLPAGAQLRGWLFAIARDVGAEHLRTVKSQRRLDRRLALTLVPSDRDGDGGLTGWAGVVDLLRRLPAERRIAFTLTQVLGFTYAEAAVVERVPVAAIRGRVARAREELVALVHVA